MWGKTPPEAVEKAFQNHDPARDKWFEEHIAAICRGEETDLTPATIVPPLSEITEAVRKQMRDFPDFTPKFPKVGVGYLRMEARRNGDELP